jgi:co-chaperonin GroES (HSP10)
MNENSQVVNVPKNILKPVMGRIFVIEVSAPERKKSNIILPTHYQKGEKAHEIVQLKRYIVVDVDPQTEIYKKYDLRRGDEVTPFIPEGAVKLDWPFVVDWGNGGETYLVFHETEIGGIIKLEPGDVDFPDIDDIDIIDIPFPNEKDELIPETE